MKQCRLMMGMPITVEIVDDGVTQGVLDEIFDYFIQVDEIFSTYKETSEISRLNRGEIDRHDCCQDLQLILDLGARTKAETGGYFDIERDGQIDPSGIVKGWAVQQAAKRLGANDWRNFSIDAGGDIQISGTNQGRPWRVGIRNPFCHEEIVKVLQVTDAGVATSGTAARGQHIYNPFDPGVPLIDVVSLTVIGPDIYEADRFATAAFAMGRSGISFIERLTGFDGYLIDAEGTAVYTSGFERYVAES